jgi:hypothetical protein
MPHVPIGKRTLAPSAHFIRSSFHHVGFPRAKSCLRYLQYAPLPFIPAAIARRPAGAIRREKPFATANHDFEWENRTTSRRRHHTPSHRTSEAKSTFLGGKEPPIGTAASPHSPVNGNSSKQQPSHRAACLPSDVKSKPRENLPPDDEPDDPSARACPCQTTRQARASLVCWSVVGSLPASPPPLP